MRTGTGLLTRLLVIRTTMRARAPDRTQAMRLPCPPQNPLAACQKRRSRYSRRSSSVSSPASDFASSDALSVSRRSPASSRSSSVEAGAEAGSLRPSPSFVSRPMFSPLVGAPRGRHRLGCKIPNETELHLPALRSYFAIWASPTSGGEGCVSNSRLAIVRILSTALRSDGCAK